MTDTAWYSLRRGVGIVLATAGLAAGLAACGSSSSSSASQAPASPAPAASAPAPVSNAPASSAAAAPGTKLAVGSSAKVKYTPLSHATPSTLKVTVQSLQKGTLDDFKGIDLDASQKAATPVYVKVKVTNLGPGTIDVDASSAAIEGLDSTGNTAQSVTFIGTFPRCPDHQSTTQMRAGSSYSNCLTFLVPGGISKVAYTGTDAYISSPVTWTTG
ncbi:MAG TPA: hypothetical protein VH279_02285 [Solirubrobacteraceae bacterium]|jgi:hypothetical protein|nr:hypothetical protein [Solirubrobacteraceae bacterium]